MQTKTTSMLKFSCIFWARFKMWPNSVCDFLYYGSLDGWAVCESEEGCCVADEGILVHCWTKLHDI